MLIEPTVATTAGFLYASHMATITTKWSGGFSVWKDADPDLSVGEIRWFESKEPWSLRPIIRMRMRVKSRTDDGNSVTYELEQP
jgi:hypothetical protein